MALGALGGQIQRLSREEILALPPTTSLAILAQCVGVSDPVIREANRSGELARVGIRVNKIGAQYLVVTSTIWAFLGLTGEAAEAPARVSA